MRNGNRKLDRSSSPAGDSSLTSAQFHILLALSEGQKHGYGVMQEVSSRTRGSVELGPGTLYRSIKQLLSRGLITEVREEGEPESGVEARRRVYALTRAGEVLATEEARRLRALVSWAEETLIPEGGSG